MGEVNRLELKLDSQEDGKNEKVDKYEMKF